MDAVFREAMLAVDWQLDGGFRRALDHGDAAEAGGVQC